MTKGIFFMFVALIFIMVGVVFFAFPSKQSLITPPVSSPSSSLPLTASISPLGESQTSETFVSSSSPNLRNLNIQANDIFSFPYTVTGEAKQWFFEGSFPVRLLDSMGKEIRVGNASAGLGWMSPDFVPFEVKWITTGEAQTATGTLLLQKDNPSDRPELDEEVLIPVRFSFETSTSRISGGCVVSGCSAQICAEEQISSDCMYKEEYICYQKAKCERQETGKCGWTLTSEIQACLEQYQ